MRTPPRRTLPRPAHRIYDAGVRERNGERRRDAVEGIDLPFYAILDRHKDAVFRLCHRMLGNAEDAEDCAQEVFIKVYRSLHSFRGQSSLMTWIYRIALNTARSRIQSLEHRFWRNKVKSLRDGHGMDTVRIDSPWESLARKEQQRLLLKAIDALPPSQKAIVLLRDMEGRTYSEIEEITRLRPGTIKSRLARARGNLYRTLRGRWS